MIALLGLLLVAHQAEATSAAQNMAVSLADFLRLSDNYRQCLILDKSLAKEPRDTYSAEGGMSAENLDLMLSDRQDRLLKRLIDQGRGKDIVEAFRLVHYTQVSDSQCRDFDPYYGPALSKLQELEGAAGLDVGMFILRGRKQHPR